MKYQLVTSDYEVSLRFVDSNEIIWHVPINPANTDYQQYLAWVAEGNEPEVIDS